MRGGNLPVRGALSKDAVGLVVRDVMGVIPDERQPVMRFGQFGYLPADAAVVKSPRARCGRPCYSLILGYAGFQELGNGQLSLSRSMLCRFPACPLAESFLANKMGSLANRQKENP
ncbi:hypothetical protein GCM10009825_30530 [Arthrobacter humicola]|uniref:Uncharacterized protein n=1 Tax=Arthrobacter humicola TaxID=409291 RepID=A0ABN2ZGL0_9MICC